MAALFFLAFAYFAVGQAAVVRTSAQTAADAAALAAAREYRDDAHDAFLHALQSGDLTGLGTLFTGLGQDGRACGAAQEYAADNKADVAVGACTQVSGPPGYTVTVISRGTVGRSVIQGTENEHATATATAVVEPRCVTQDDNGDNGDNKDKHGVAFACPGGDLVVDPTAPGFTLNMADFFTVHLSK